ncbi:GAF domain-containing sensor histidine kinase [bacterium]|nr:GAF domain-containing sensor histidine kinase [bacterium]
MRSPASSASSDRNVRYVDRVAVRRAATFGDEERAILHAINLKIAAAPSLAEVVGFVADMTAILMPCDRVSLAFVEEDGTRVTSYWTQAHYQPVLLAKGYTRDLVGSSLRQVIERGTPRIIHDLEQYLADHPASHPTRLLVQEGVRSSMTCPLIVDGRNVGLLFRSSRQKAAYDDHRVAIQLAIGERLSQSVEKAYNIEQLNAANRSYMEMLGFVSHELKGPVASMVLDGQVLMDGYRGQLSPEQAKGVGKIINKGEYLLGLVRDYLDLARIEGGELALTARPDVDLLGEVVEPSVDMMQAAIDDKKMHVVQQAGDGGVRAECDPSLLKIVMTNLVGNAAKYGCEGGEIRVSLQRHNGTVSASVWNEGPGFPESERGRLFRKFSRLQTPDLLKQKGTGVGLYTTWRIIQLHGGTIAADSEEGKWAEFRFAIPQPLPKP